jgi:hypothetical protein
VQASTIKLQAATSTHGKGKAEAVPVTRFEQLNLKTKRCVRNVWCCEACGCEFDASAYFFEKPTSS